ncbi:MAG: hypothetical protein JO110_21040 [Acetobacteraceae bacterium]|nr:hypothetical protein [Acetobacteraceae bacterium]
MTNLRKAGMIAVLTCALAAPFGPVAYAGSGGFSPYPWEQLPTTQELQTPDYSFYAPGSHHLFAQGVTPHWPRLAPREQSVAQNQAWQTRAAGQSGSQ